MNRDLMEKIAYDAYCDELEKIAANPMGLLGTARAWMQGGGMGRTMKAAPGFLRGIAEDVGGAVGPFSSGMAGRVRQSLRSAADAAEAAPAAFHNNRGILERARAIPKVFDKKGRALVNEERQDAAKILLHQRSAQRKFRSGISGALPALGAGAGLTGIGLWAGKKVLGAVGRGASNTVSGSFKNFGRALGNVPGAFSGNKGAQRQMWKSFGKSKLAMGITGGGGLATAGIGSSIMNRPRRREYESQY